MSKRKPDTQLAKAIRDLQSEIDSKLVILKALREQYDSDEIDYYSYIQTEAWREQRMKILRRDNFQCVCCGTAKNLHVHHITYENLGAEEEGDLVTLCSSCHANVHSMEDLKRTNTEIPEDLPEIPAGLTRDEFDLLTYATALGDVYLDLEFKYQIEPKYFDTFSAKELAQNFAEGVCWGDDIDEAIEDNLERLNKCEILGKHTDNIEIVKGMYFQLLYKVNRKAIEHFIDALNNERAWSNNPEVLDARLKALGDYLNDLREKVGEL